MRYVHIVSSRLLQLAVGTAACAAFVAPSACSSTNEVKSPPQDSGVDSPVPPPPKDAGPPEDTGAKFVPPTSLSETGLYSDFAARTLAPGVVRFAPGHPLWADGAEKERYFLLPAGKKIDTSDIDRWRFPIGTKAWKSFKVGGKLIETRLMWKITDDKGVADDWYRVAFVWKADGSDAVAEPLGVQNASGTTHDVPSQEDCVFCHVNVVDSVIGFSALELSNPGLDPDGGTPDGGAGEMGRLLEFASKGMFSNNPTKDFVVPGTGNDHDAVAYMHGNCGFCHNGDGRLQSQSPIRLRVLTTDTTLAKTGAYTTTINTPMRHTVGDVDKAVVPGQPDKSELYLRMIAPDITRMPPKGTKVIDDTGSGYVRDWILALPP